MKPVKYFSDSDALVTCGHPIRITTFVSGHRTRSEASTLPDGVTVWRV